MKKGELRPVCSLGMFDFFKGLAILSVIWGHTVELFPMNSGSVGGLIGYSLGNLSVYAFFISAGYGIRKRPAAKCFDQVYKTFVIPYLYALVATPILLTAVHARSFHYLPGALVEGLHVLTGFCLGQYPTTTYFGWLTYSCGPLWFVVALAVAWIIFNVLLNRVKEKWLPWAVGVIGLLGFFSSQLINQLEIAVPFCLTHALITVPCLYLGYWAKKAHFFEKKPTTAMWIAFAASVALYIFGFSRPQSFSSQEYPFGPLSLLSFFIVSMGLLYLMTHINRRYNAVVNAFERVGYNTIDILVLHTIEYYGMLWYRVAERFAERPNLGIAVILALRALFIVAGLLLKALFKKTNGFRDLKAAFPKQEKQAEKV